MKAFVLALVVACGSSQKPLKTVETQFGELRVDDGGRGDVPIIFVHGLAGDRTVWRETLAHVREKHRAIAVDLHGFGESKAKGDTFDVSSHANDVMQVAKATGAPKVILVGHSYGGTVVSELAASHPEIVAGVVLVDPSGDFLAVPAEQRKQMEQILVDQPKVGFAMMLQGAQPGVSERVMATLQATNPDAYKRTFMSMWTFDPKPALRGYQGPRIDIIGALFADLPFMVHKLFPDIETHVIAGTSHWPFLDKPAEFFTVLDPFLMRVDPVPSRAQ
jgi:pimeloyl-ACP methyl ester carboxylesterase